MSGLLFSGFSWISSEFMNFEEAAKLINPDIYARFKQAVELGKWPDGRILTKAQKEVCLQAIMLYEAKQNMQETDRVGYIDARKKTGSCVDKNGDTKKHDFPGDTATIRILH